MALFTVGFIAQSDNVLILELIEGDDWREAFAKHPKCPWGDADGFNALDFIPHDYEDAQSDCFDMDCAMACIVVQS